MGKLINGEWTNAAFPTDAEGHFRRKPVTFRQGFGEESPAVAERYHMYVSHACPWAHRTMIVRSLLGLEEKITRSVVNWFMGDEGWTFLDGPGVEPDTLNNATYVRDVYTAADPKFTGRVTVPILWDKERGVIVNNESRDIIRMFSRELRGQGTRDADLSPVELTTAIDEMITANYEPINNGVYRAGFSRSQGAYDQAIDELFSALDRVESVLEKTRFLCGDQLTEADICLFTTLIRFDVVYHTHFKCNVRRIVDYPSLWGFVRDVYQTPGVAETCNFDHIRNHYFGSHESVNPSRIVARGPELALDEPHGRG